MSNPDSLSQTAQDTLETMIDKYGLANILDSLSAICRDKADHVRSNWQDERTAKYWEKTAATIDKNADKLIAFCPLA